MRINNNIPALQTYNSIRQANRATQSSMLRLSSGFKINSAKDDAAGLAISNKMRMQINGLEMAGRNAMDGVSLVQTADGGLSEVHNILQRLRELAIKAANDTMEDSDRAKIQTEVDFLLAEIDGISNRTEFNTIKLFGSKANGGNGFTFFDPSTNITSNVVKGASSDLDFPDGDFTFTVTGAGTPSSIEITVPSVIDVADKTFAIGSKNILFDENDTQLSVLQKISDAAKELGYEVRGSGNQLTIFSQGGVDLTYDAATGITNTAPVDGTDATIAPGATFTLASGENVPIKDVVYNDNQITFILDHPQLGKKATVQVNGVIDATGTFTPNTGNMNVSATYRDYSNIILQIGPSKGLEMNIHIPEVSTKTLGLTELSYLPNLESINAIDTCDKAINTVSKIRSQLGAYQNRLEYVTASVDITAENMSSALSRIADTDMAREMSFFTQQNVIGQAGMSILAQANQRAQQILQLVSR